MSDLLKEAPMVSIKCITYNHVNYIAKCLEGFVMQITDFSFQVIVHDDASFDGTDKIVKEYSERYPEFIIPIFETENQYSKHDGSINKIMAPYLTGKYMAYCEGDDFWTDPYMLQTCVDFLELNQDYSCVFGNRVSSNEDETNFKKIRFRRDLTLMDIMSGINMGLRNMVFRNEINKIQFEPKNLNGDLKIYYKCGIAGKMKYLDRDFSVYRITGKGVASGRRGKEVLLNCFRDYYYFHEATGFKYQRYLVSYQVRQLFSTLKQGKYVFYCISLMRRFHVPSSKRFFWFPVEFCIKLLNKLLGK